MLSKFKRYLFRHGADGYVQLQPDQTGKQVQMFENTVSGNVVEAMAVSLIDSTGWSNSFVQCGPDNTGKKMQYYENTVGGTVVEALAVVLVNTAGSPY